MSKRRVVVTGMGVVTSIGNDLKSSWEGFKASKNGTATITDYDVSNFTTQFASLVKNFPMEEFIPKKDLKKMDGFIQYGVAAACMAIDDSGLEVTENNADRIGVSIGAGVGGIGTIEENHNKFLNSGPRRVSPFFVPATIINMISGQVSIRYGLKGPNLAITTACTTGTHNIGNGARLIGYGDADVMVVGGAEHGSTPLSLTGFSAAKALSCRNDSPETASRPWDKDRDGFVMGDGAGVLVLEEYEHAKARGAKIYAELVGYGMSGDAYHMTSPSEGGEGAALAMRNAIRDAGVNVEEIGYINAHGTSTPLGDVAETQAIKQVFGEAAKSVAVSSSKSMIGHLLGASGAVEAIVSVMTLKDQVITPTINLFEPGEGCDLDYVPHTARDAKNLEYVLSNSFGFGGTNGSLVFKRF